MAKGKSGSVGGGIIGVLVLIVLIPREIWIALGIAVIVALAIYLICAMAEGSTTETVSLNLILTGLDSGVAQVHTWYGDIPDRRAQI